MKTKKIKSPFPFSGMILFNKPSGMTSHDVVARMRGFLKTKAIGHAGTLDPMAEGLLTLLVEKGTKLSQWVTSEEKEYEGSLKFGAETSTLDKEGEVVKSHSTDHLNDEILTEALACLQGECELEVPKFSAIKVQGQRLYKKALKQEEFEVPKRKMIFYHTEVSPLAEDSLSFYLKCSKGSYIRSWAQALGRKTQAGAYLTSLKRVGVGDYSLSDAVDFSFFEERKELNQSELLEELCKTQALRSMLEILKDRKSLYLSDFEAKLFTNGQIPKGALKRLIPLQREAMESQKELLTPAISMSEERLCGLLKIEKSGKTRIERVFN